MDTFAEAISAIVITGPVGAGKSATANAMSEELQRFQVRHVVVDMDHIRWMYPRSNDDPFATRLGYRNLAAMWPNFRELDIAYVVIADVVETREQAREYERAMPGATVTVVRLDVSLQELERRLRGRESEASIAWYLKRAPELRGIMEREGIGDLVIDVGSRSPVDVAREIISVLQPSPDSTRPGG